MKLIELTIFGISFSQTQTGAYALILSEIDGNRKLPIVIGGFEAQSIAIGLEKDVNPPRPLTHDLFKNLLDSYKISIKHVIIHKLVDGIFFANIICEKGKKQEVLDARTSDAVAIAIRSKVPIYTLENVLSEASFSENKYEKNKSKSDENWIENFVKSQTSKNIIPKNISNLSNKNLLNLLQKLVASEDYERAVKIRDEISKRKNK